MANLSYGGYLNCEINLKQLPKVVEYIEAKKQALTFDEALQEIVREWGLKVAFSPPDDEGYWKVVASNVAPNAMMEKAYFLSAEARDMQMCLWVLHYKVFVMKPYAKAPETRSAERHEFR